MRLIDADALIERHCEGCSKDIQEACKTDPICATLLSALCMMTITAPTENGRTVTASEHF